jgi:hypothetical protein
LQVSKNFENKSDSVFQKLQQELGEYLIFNQRNSSSIVKSGMMTFIFYYKFFEDILFCNETVLFDFLIPLRSLMV